jgi:hypothetical protein
MEHSGRGCPDAVPDLSARRASGPNRLEALRDKPDKSRQIRLPATGKPIFLWQGPLAVWALIL